MRISTGTVLAGLLAAGNGLNILITNDDGFGTANIRELYNAMKEFGHNVYIVSSVTNQSGTGGTVKYTKEKNLTTDGDFGIIKQGAPSIGTDPFDSHIWYYNGTPSVCVQVALDYVRDRFTEIENFDLVLSGPNYGKNLGPFLFTMAGTLGATYTAIERGIPAIAISAGYEGIGPYFWVNETTPAGLRDPSTITAQLAANLAQQLIENVAAEGGDRLLPLGYGLHVNIPLITSYTSDKCINPPFIHTRFTGSALANTAPFNDATGLFTWGTEPNPGINQCIHGDCSLPGETVVLASGCKSSVTPFTVDWDAPVADDNRPRPDVRRLLTPVVQYEGAEKLVGGMDALKRMPVHKS
ncbi:hypothetical protein PZA11_003639 [Diplocarpon coronariae]|uniref:Survival protein SurE-like phosphatase/nucleotidase domain-containing protein n=1 Tax=Diplocarpon coronariae TaxID=2795749 RepID=A0A218ZGT8_9HELO|nr:hypothetical protein B2J93_3816 [Marssonina coronariae]